MRTRALAAVACVVLLSGCREWPDPVIRSITPNQMTASEATAVQLVADVPIQTTVDYSEQTATIDSAAVIKIGKLEVGTGQYAKNGVFDLTVPTLLDPGAYDVTLTLSDGREATLPAGFTVSAGQWPDGYTIDPIGAQQQLVPFTVTVRATGPNAASFHGNVRFEVPPGATVGPQVSQPFVNGVLTQQITIRSTRNQELLIVTDVAGHRVTSNMFALQ